MCVDQNYIVGTTLIIHQTNTHNHHTLLITLLNPVCVTLVYSNITGQRKLYTEDSTESFPQSVRWTWAKQTPATRWCVQQFYWNTKIQFLLELYFCMVCGGAVGILITWCVIRTLPPLGGSLTSLGVLKGHGFFFSTFNTLIASFFFQFE